jgi:60S ribosome subunit biogenesis protein NIP7
MGDSILQVSPELGENEPVIITNKNGEAIGIGRTRFAGRTLLQKGRITITTLVDAGSYLRDEDTEGQAKLAKKPS